MISIFVFDTPKSCAECKLCDRTNGWGDWKCMLSNEYLPFEDDDSNERALHCPLRPLPEQMTWGHTSEYIYGYNACLAEIKGETE